MKVLGDSMKGGENLYVLKMAALLHDPPHKPFLLARQKSHEEEAREIAGSIFGGQILQFLKSNAVRIADSLASMFDRWPLSIIMQKRYIPSLFPVREVKIKNIFAPFLEVEYDQEIKENIVKDYIEELRKYLGKTGGLREKYHVLYSLYESLWIMKGLPVGPAETRVPTHSVFDHVYATASMINWVIHSGGEKESVKGLLIGLDIAGVQSYISSSRKLRDLWISSYIVSALMWYTIAEIVEKLGPDIVITPSLRMNPFYLYWLKHKVNQDDLRSQLESVEKIVYMTNDVWKLYKDLGIPPYAVLPERVTLILPPWNYVKNLLGTDKEIKEYFKNRFMEGWKLLWELTKRYAEERAKNRRDLLWKFIYKVFVEYEKTFKDAKFHENPPLVLRIEFVEVISGNANWKLYDEKYRELSARISASKYIRRDPSISLDLHELTRKSFDKEALGIPKKSKRGFDYCTVCGKLPALIILPTEERDERVKEEEKYLTLKKYLIDFLSVNEIDDKDLLNFIQVFSPGEKLCPWCFLKRVVSLEPRILKTLLVALPYSVDRITEFVSKLSKEYGKSLHFPSTAHIASARLYEEMFRDKSIFFEAKPSKHIPLNKQALNVIKKAIYSEEYIIMWPLARRLWDKSGEELSNEDRVIAYAILSLDPENLWLSIDRRRNWIELLSKRGLSHYLWRYYALVRADGDSIGDLLEGKLTAFLPGLLSEDFYYKLRQRERSRKFERVFEKAKEFLKQYILSSCEGEYKRFVEECILEERECERYISEIAKVGRYKKEDVQELVERIRSEFKKIIEEELRIPVTPTYHVSVSAALIRVSLLDSAVVFSLGGIVVYAGGDDLLALLPVDKVLNAIHRSRLIFGGLGNSEKPGFMKLYNTYYAMLGNVCRSYCAYIAHYHYPLSLVLERSSTLLKDAKKVKLRYVGEKGEPVPSAKDVLITVYNPRGGEEYAMIPLSWRRPIITINSRAEIGMLIDAAAKLLRFIEIGIENGGRLSHSFIYDLLNQDLKQVINELKERLKDIYLRPIVHSTLEGIIKNIINHNLGGISVVKKEEVLEKVYEELFRYMFEEVGIGSWDLKGSALVSRVDELVLLNFARIAKLVRSGMR